MDTLLLVTAMALGAASSTCLYLASPNQGLLQRTLPAEPLYWAGSLLGAASLASSAVALYPATALAFFGTWMMLVLVVLPHLGALSTALRGES